jgi:hypothetical protein
MCSKLSSKGLRRANLALNSFKDGVTYKESPSGILYSSRTEGIYTVVKRHGPSKAVLEGKVSAAQRSSNYFTKLVWWFGNFKEWGPILTRFIIQAIRVDPRGFTLHFLGVVIK